MTAGAPGAMRFENMASETPQSGMGGLDGIAERLTERIASMSAGFDANVNARIGAGTDAGPAAGLTGQSDATDGRIDLAGAGERGGLSTLERLEAQLNAQIAQVQQSAQVQQQLAQFVMASSVSSSLGRNLNMFLRGQ